MITKQQAQDNGFKIMDSDKKIAEQKDEKLAALKKLIPNLVNSDNQLDTKALQDFINLANTTSNNKGYELTFAGKGIARAKADSETSKELQTEKKQSKDFDTTDNVVIRGDNLEVLKILQQNYFGKIKMIYIDPPYNTKSENFIYNDNFKQNEGELLKTYGLDEEEDKETLNFLHNVYGTRSHSGWLSFMYPRLKLARDLLKEDGVIFISIDDNEVANLRIMCDEIFGEDNFLMDLVRKTKSTTNDAKEGINIQHENCLVYCKNKQDINLFGGEKDLSRYTNPDDDPNGEWASGDPSKAGYVQNQHYEIKNPYTGKIDLPPTGRSWVFTTNTIQKHIDNGTICFKKEYKENERGFIYKRHKKNLKTTQKTLDSLVFVDNEFMNQKATKNLLNLGLAEYFTYPKGYEYIYKLVQHATNPNDLILDFFAGSGTTGDAVMQLNAEDGGNRKFILVQWDEEIGKIKPIEQGEKLKNKQDNCFYDESIQKYRDISEHKEAYNFCIENNFKPVISSITLERLNRAGEKIKKELQGKKDLFKENKKLDIGYKVFSLTEKPKTAEDNQLELENKRIQTLNTLYNMLCATCKPLHTKIIELIKDKLYKADNEIYLLGKIDREKLEPYKDQKINIDGWSDISLENWLNLDVGNKENITIVY